MMLPIGSVKIPQSMDAMVVPWERLQGRSLGAVVPPVMETHWVLSGECDPTHPRASLVMTRNAMVGIMPIDRLA